MIHRNVGPTIARTIALLVSLWLIPQTTLAAVPGYYRAPTVSGDQVVFTSEGDLWKASLAGGVAMRLTSHPASESMPQFSPDGKSIAFTADYFGTSDVYVIPSEGGEPKRLTFSPNAEQVIGWTPDGKSVLYRSRPGGLWSVEKTYEISVDGGEPRALPIGKAALVSFSPDGTKLAFNRHSWQANWKRYKGGTAPDVWVADLKNNGFAPITEGKVVDMFPMWIGERIYFLSERTGSGNIFSMNPDGTDKKQITTHTDYDVRWPDTDGKSIVYAMGADIWKLDVASGETKKVEITLASDRIRERPRIENAGKTLDSFDLSKDGKKLLVASRGELYTTGVKPGGRIVQLSRSSGTRERLASFSPDGTKAVCITDETGEQELAIFDTKGKTAPKVLTKRSKGWLFQPVWSPDGKHIAFADMTATLMLADPETGEIEEVDRGEVWEINEYTFSPDGKWLAYSKMGANRLSSIYVYSIETGKITPVGAGFCSDYSPAWGIDGKHLFFISSRSFNPVMDSTDTSFAVNRSDKICFVVLAKDGKSLLLPDELLEDEKADKDKDDAKDDENEDDDSKKDTDDKSGGATSKPATTQSADEKDKLPEVKLDVEGISGRVFELPIGAGNFNSLGAAEGKIFYLNNPVRGLAEEEAEEGTPQAGQLRSFDVKAKKDEEYLSNVSRYALSGDGKRIAWLAEGEIRVADTSGKPPETIEEKLNLSSLPLEVVTQDEWKQIFNEAWRLQRDFFWADNMTGVDWQGMKKRYEPLVERVSTRGELNDLIGQLIGELGNSHTYIMGGDSSFDAPPNVAVGLLGAEIILDGKSKLHQFSKVYRAEEWETDTVSPLSRNDVAIKDGDYLVAINGQELAPNESVDQKLTNLAGVQVLLTVCSKADKSDVRDVQVETLPSDNELRYADWCRRNREYVAEKSGGRIGYFHLPDMGGAGLVKFVKGFYPQWNKEALLIDERDNGGGFVSQMIIEKLKRTVWAYDMPRRGMIGTYPNTVHVGPKALLINEHAGSDGDIFPHSFKHWKLGPLIGKRTWGGVVGIRGDKGFVDSGMSTQPEFAWFDANGWSIEGHGVDPDIEVDYRPEDFLAGRDPQLDKGIEYLMQQLKENPPQKPKAPALPDRTK